MVVDALGNFGFGSGIRRTIAVSIAGLDKGPPIERDDSGDLTTRLATLHHITPHHIIRNVAKVPMRMTLLSKLFSRRTEGSSDATDAR